MGIYFRERVTSIQFTVKPTAFNGKQRRNKKDHRIVLTGLEVKIAYEINESFDTHTMSPQGHGFSCSL
jgi:hypothetical protein